MEDLRNRAIRGGFAKLCGQAINFSLRIISVIVMARLLDPKDFGLFAMVTAVTGVYTLFTTAGLSTVSVQRDTITDEQISTLFWANILVGATLALLCLVTAPVLVSFFHEPLLFWPTVAVAGGFVFNAAGVQHSALLQRHLRWLAVSVIETLSQVVSMTVGIAMAVADFGYWALVGAAIVAPAVKTISVWIVTQWVPGRPVRGIGIRSMLHFGGTLTLNGLIVYVAYNLEKVLLGRYWGADALGVYGRAYQLINIPTSNLNEAIGDVALSVFSRLQHDSSRLKSYFLKGYSLVNSLTIPTTTFFALFPDEIILVLLGPKWKDAAIIFRLMAPTVLVFGMINPLGWLLISLGLQYRNLAIAMVIAPVLIAAYVIGLPYGPPGVASAYSAAMILLLVPVSVWCVHGTTISPRDLFLAISRPLLSAIAAAALAFGALMYFSQLQSPYLRLLFAGGVMVSFYSWMLLFIMGQKTVLLDLLIGLKGTPNIRDK
jgi:O-antigen/teichoic acid export membrane protein